MGLGCPSTATVLWFFLLEKIVFFVFLWSLGHFKCILFLQQKRGISNQNFWWDLKISCEPCYQVRCESPTLVGLWLVGCKIDSHDNLICTYINYVTYRAVFFSWLPVNHGRVSHISCEIYVIYGQFYPWKMSKLGWMVDIFWSYNFKSSVHTISANLLDDFAYIP